MKNFKKILNILFILISFLGISQEKNETIKENIEYINKLISLEKEEIICLFKLEEETKKLIDFLKKEGATEENKNFIKEIIKIFVKLNYEYPKHTKDNYPGKNDGYPFEWWKDDEWIKNNLKISRN